MDVDLPTAALRERWDDVVDDLEAMAATLDDDGWSTVTLHAGDVTTRAGDSEPGPGLDVLVADNEFERLERQIADGAEFSETEVYRSAAGGVAFLICALRDPVRRVAVLVPAFYPQEGTAARALAQRARGAGTLDVHVRSLAREWVITVTIDDPGLVFPSDWRASTDG